jgi:hypothetical protein
MMTVNCAAPNGPGIPAHWNSRAKIGVGMALTNQIGVWFTLCAGTFNEIYYPHIDKASSRDLRLIVTDGAKFFFEEKCDIDDKIEWLADGVPAFRLVNTCRESRFQSEKQIGTDPHRDTVLQQVRFGVRQGALSDFHLHGLLASHWGKTGSLRLMWRFNHKFYSLPDDKILRTELVASASIYWTANKWNTCDDIRMHDAGLRSHMVDLPIAVPEGMQIKVTFLLAGRRSLGGSGFYCPHRSLAPGRRRLVGKGQLK